MAEFDVVCVGVATLDTIAVLPELPGEDQRVLAQPFTTAGGGPAATAAVALARLGASVAFCGIVGDDDAGSTVRSQLEAEGVDIRWLETRPDARTTESVVLVTEATGARTIITTPSSAPDPSSIPLDASGWVHTDQTGFPAVRAALARRGGFAGRLSVDGGNAIHDLELTGIDLYAPTAGALRTLFDAPSLEERVRLAQAAGARTVVATDGARGSVAFDGTNYTEVPPLAVEPLSTIGAGDVFHGALLAALVRGDELTDAVRFANVVAALSCRSLDGRSGIPTLAETQTYELEKKEKN
ncbi:carbohydrate kinase family protein [Leifsonia sp. NPDC058230]|uniref:carbohydrate kinase family protein n=1 Tax=Leifsonia sp. NPDC058230 TaxID=3346391 RepID=UPI0036DD583B